MLAYNRLLLEGMIPSRQSWPSTTMLQLSRRDLEALQVIDADLAETDLGSETRWQRWIQKCDSLQRLKRERERDLALQEAHRWMTVVNAEPAIDASEADGRFAVTLARMGRTEEALAAGSRFVAARSATNQVRARWEREIILAQVSAYLRRPNDCADLLAKLLRVPSGLTVPMLQVDPAWDHVRDDPGFKALLADPMHSAPL